MSVRALSLALAALAATPYASRADVPTPAAEQARPAPAPPAPPAPPQAPVQARPGWTSDDAPRTDQTVDVAKGTRLVLSSQAGEVVVKAWDRDAVRVQASHSGRERVDVQTADGALRVRTRSARGPGGPVDYTLTVPKWMSLSLSGTYLAANIEGAAADVNVETVGGDLVLKGGSGAVSLRSIEGAIKVDGASGKVNASTVNDSITLTNVSGDVVAETVNGDVSITAAKASSLEVSTVNGDVRFETPVVDHGTFRVNTHQGDIRVSLGAQASATVFVRTFRGDFSSDFPITLPKDERENDKRFNFTLGAGGARVELQSFQGDIHVAKGGLRGRERERERGRRGARVDMPSPAAIAAEVQAEVSAELAAEFGPAWADELTRLGTLAAQQVGGVLQRLPVPPAPPAPPAARPAPPAPPAPMAPKPPRP
ncbi:MAG: DUF4097 family beta strand repeat-containing protein [Vicinamibacterales bacterium]